MPKPRPDDDVMGLFADEPEEESDLGRFAHFILDPNRVRASVERQDTTAPAAYKAAVYGGEWAEPGDEPQAEQAADLLLAQIGNGEFPQSWNELREHLIGAIAVYQTIVGGPVGDNYNGMLLEGLFLQYGPKWIEAHVAQLLRKFPTYRKG
jgi:hypothetical protein